MQIHLFLVLLIVAWLMVSISSVWKTAGPRDGNLTASRGICRRQPNTIRHRSTEQRKAPRYIGRRCRSGPPAPQLIPGTRLPLLVLIPWPHRTCSETKGNMPQGCGQFSSGTTMEIFSVAFSSSHPMAGACPYFKR